MTGEVRPFDIDTSSVLRTEMKPSPEDWEVFGALQEFNVPKPLSPDWAIYNTVSIGLPGIPGKVLLSRAVDMRNIKKEAPDMNSLQVCVTGPSGSLQRLKDLELLVDGRIVNWEDSRVGPDQTLGFTVVIREGDRYNPHPALVKVGIKDGNLKIVGDPKIFEDLTGKNVIPLGGGFIYRPDSVSHKLHYLNLQGKLSKVIDFSDFRSIKWLSKKMGVAARPIELEDGLKLLLIHGVREGMGIDGNVKDDIYAIGIVVLDDIWRVKAVDKEPLLVRGDFLGNLKTNIDLRPEKEVVYLCDFTETEDGLILPVNVGDRITVFKHISYSQLRARIDNLL